MANITFFICVFIFYMMLTTANAAFTKHECPQCATGSQGEDLRAYVLASDQRCSREICEDACKKAQPPNTNLVCVKCEQLENRCSCCDVRTNRHRSPFTKQECPQCATGQGEEFRAIVLASDHHCSRKICEDSCKTAQPPNTKLVCVKCQGNTCSCFDVKSKD